MVHVLNIKTTKRNDFIDITDDLLRLIKKEKFDDGIIVLFVPHTTAGLIVNEHYDPDVISDIKESLNAVLDVVQTRVSFKHREGNSDAHFKTALVNNSLSLLVENNQLVLGTWQRILFLDFDGPRNRKIRISTQI